MAEAAPTITAENAPPLPVWLKVLVGLTAAFALSGDWAFAGAVWSLALPSMHAAPDGLFWMAPAVAGASLLAALWLALRRRWISAGAFAFVGPWVGVGTTFGVLSV